MLKIALPALTFALSLAGCGQPATGPARGEDAGVSAPSAEASKTPGAPLAAQAATPVTRTFRDWLVVCDNANRCTALTGSDGDQGWLKVEIDAGPDARPVVRFGGAGFTGEDAGARPALSVDGRAVDLNGDVVAALGGGRRAAVSGHDRARPISLSGAAAAFLWIDERQGRLNTSTALIRRGDSAAATVPAAPSRTRIQAVRLPGDGAGQERVLPPALEALDSVKECRVDVPEGRARTWAVGSDQLLWLVPCWRGAYNMGERLFVADAQGRGAHALGLPTALKGATPFVVNGDFDPATGTLSSFDKGRGVGDCGYVRNWVWTGRGFALKREAGMEECWGLTPEEWPVIYEAVVE